MNIGFIGAGNMAGAIIRGIVKAGVVDPKTILVSNPSRPKLEALQEQCGVEITSDNQEVAKKSSLLFLCVKPHILETVIEEIKDIVKPETMLISIAAGKTIAEIEKRFGKAIKLVRVMPNAPALVGAGISAVAANPLAAEDETSYQLILKMLESLGEVQPVKEEMIDVVGQIAGASVAWISMIIEGMADGAIYEGMSREMAYRFIAAGVAGTGRQILAQKQHPALVKDMCASPRGTTIESIRVLEEHGVRGAFMDAVITACEKAKKM